MMRLAGGGGVSGSVSVMLWRILRRFAFELEHGPGMDRRVEGDRLSLRCRMCSACGEWNMKEEGRLRSRIIAWVLEHEHAAGLEGQTGFGR